MKIHSLVMVALACLVAAAMPVLAGEGAHRIGVGAHYWQTVDDIDADNVDEDGFSYMATYQCWPGLLGLELDVEWFEEGFAGANEVVYAPQAYLLIGNGLYGAVGAGGYYTDGEFAEDPFFAFRVGLAVPVFFLNLDINANYRFETWDDLSDEAQDIDTDTVTLGAAVRLVF